MVPRNHQEKSYWPKSGFLKHKISQTVLWYCRFLYHFSRYLQTFFSLHYKHSCPYFLVRKKLLHLVVLTERLKKIFLTTNFFVHPNIKPPCLQKTFYILALLFISIAFLHPVLLVPLNLCYLVYFLSYARW